MARQGLQGRSSRCKMRTARRDPSKVPAVDLVGRDFDRENIDELWIDEQPKSGPTRAGCISQRSSTPARAACSAGRSPTTSAPSSASTRSRRPSRHDAAGGTSPGVSCSTQTTAPLHRRRVHERPADRFASDNRWEPSVTVTTRWPSLFFSSFKREVVDGEHFATRAEARAEIFAWLTGTTRSGFTPRSTSVRRSSMKSTSQSNHS